MTDERFYAEVAAELQLRGPIPGLWAKAFAEASGAESEAKARYLRYRAEQLAEAEGEAVREKAAAGKERQRLAAEEAEVERRARARKEGITPIHLVLLGLIAFFIIAAVIAGAHGTSQETPLK